MIYSGQGFTVWIPDIVCLNNIFNTVQRNSVIQHAAPKFSFAVDFPSLNIQGQFQVAYAWGNLDDSTTNGVLTSTILPMLVLKNTTGSAQRNPTTTTMVMMQGYSKYSF